MFYLQRALTRLVLPLAITLLIFALSAGAFGQVSPGATTTPGTAPATQNPSGIGQPGSNQPGMNQPGTTQPVYPGVTPNRTVPNQNPNATPNPNVDPKGTTSPNRNPSPSVTPNRNPTPSVTPNSPTIPNSTNPNSGPSDDDC